MSNNSVGVVGGGQLAMMLVEAANKLNVEIIVQARSLKEPALRKSSRFVLSELEDIKGTRQLVQQCSCVTFENEWVNIETLKSIETKNSYFLPPLLSLAPLVSKLSQRQLLTELGIPGTDWIPLDSDQVSSSKLPLGWTFPLMAKSSSGGYDGKGNRPIENFKELQILIDSVVIKEWFLETWVPYEKELALVASRDRNGKIRTFPLVETSQKNHICNWVLAPANVSHDVERMAYNIAASLLRELNYIGVLAIEFFYGPNGLQVNEIAPRTHNSAHFSIEACISSQFDHQVCIAADLNVPSSELNVPGALMVNLLGLNDPKAYPLKMRLNQLRKCDQFNLHWYDKEIEAPGRKLGHITVLLFGIDDSHRRVEAAKALEKIKSIWPMDCKKID